MTDVGSSPTCPRCGYDLRGEVDRWTSACPMSGRCAECGLHFDWADLLSEARVIPRWCVESAGTVRSLLGRSLGTAMMALRPGRFWGELRMSHTVRPRRIAAFLVLCAFVFIVTCAVSSASQAFLECREYEQMGGTLARGSVIRAMAGAALLPASEQSGAFYLLPRSIAPIPVSPPRWRWEEMLQVVRGPIGFLAVIQVCGVLLFVALPISRRRAKVRWVHVARAGVYTLVPLFPVILLLPLVPAIGATRAGAWWLSSMLLLLVAPLVLVVGWRLAVARYMCMPHGWGIAVAVVLVGMLAPLSIISLWRPGPIGLDLPDGGFTVVLNIILLLIVGAALLGVSVMRHLRRAH